jgi:hypothetical protein
VKTILGAVIFLILSQVSAAQVIQKNHCANASSCPLPNPTTAGDLLVVIHNSTAQVKDLQGDTFDEVDAAGWYGNPSPLSYAAGIFGGSVTVQLDSQTESIFVAEYPPAKLDQVAKPVFLCCSPSGTLGPLTVTAPNEVLIAWAIFPSWVSVTIPPSPGLTTEDSGSVIVQDEKVGPGTYSVTFPQSYAWGARMVAFTLLDSPQSKYKAPYKPIQVKECERSSDNHVLPCQFDNPVSDESLLVVVTSGTIDPISDSHNNSWYVGVDVPFWGAVPVWYALNAKDGTDTVYFSDNAVTAIIAEYPPSLGFDTGSYGTYKGQNVGEPPGSSDVGTTTPIETSGPCELLIGWGVSGKPLGTLPWNPDAAPNFTLRASEYNQLVLEDSTSSIPGAYITSMDWKDYAHWNLGLAAFKMGGCK